METPKPYRFLFLTIIFFFLLTTSVYALELEPLTIEEKINQAETLTKIQPIAEKVIAERTYIFSPDGFVKLKKNDLDVKDIAIGKGIIAITGEYKELTEVTFYTPMPNTQFSVIHYDGITDDKQLVREQGTVLIKNILSDDNGKVTYYSTEFSTQILSFPSPLNHDAGSDNTGYYLNYFFTDYDRVRITSDDVGIPDFLESSLKREEAYEDDEFFTDENLTIELEHRGYTPNQDPKLNLASYTTITGWTKEILVTAFDYDDNVTFVADSFDWVKTGSGVAPIQNLTDPFSKTQNVSWSLFLNDYFSGYTTGGFYLEDPNCNNTNNDTMVTTGDVTIDAQASMCYVAIGLTSEKTLYDGGDYTNPLTYAFSTLGTGDDIVVYGNSLITINSSDDVRIGLFADSGEITNASTYADFIVTAGGGGGGGSSTSTYFWNETGDCDGLCSGLTATAGSISPSDAEVFNGSYSVLAGGTSPAGYVLMTPPTTTYNLTMAFYYPNSSAKATVAVWGIKDETESCSADGDGVCFGSRSTTSTTNFVTLVDNTWNETSVTLSGGWHSLEYRIGGTSYELLLDGVSIAIGTSSNIDKHFVYTLPTGNDIYFDDMFIINETIESEEDELFALQLYNFPTPIELEYDEQTYFDFDDYFSNYDEIRILFNDTLTINASVNSSTMDYDFPQANFTITGNGDKIQWFISTASLNYTSNITVFAGREGNYINDTSVFSIGAIVIDPVPPTQIIDFNATLNMDQSDYTSFNLGGYFTNYQGVTLYYQDGNTTYTNYTVIDGSQKIISTDDITLSIRTLSSNILLEITTLTNDFSNILSINVSNAYGEVSDAFLIRVSTPAPANETLLQSAFSSIEDFYPDADDITLKQQMLYIILTMVLTAVVLGVGIFYTDDEFIKKLFMFVLGVILIIEVFFFIANSYIPVIVLVLLALFGSLILYAIMRKTTA